MTTTILENLKVKQKALRTDRNTGLAECLSVLIGDTELASKGSTPVTEDTVVKMVRKYAGNIRQMRDIYASQDNIQALQKRNILNGELALVETFLPAEKVQLTEYELVIVVNAFVNASAIKPNMKDVMAYLKQSHEGQYDGKQASAVVKAALE